MWMKNSFPSLRKWSPKKETEHLDQSKTKRVSQKDLQTHLHMFHDNSEIGGHIFREAEGPRAVWTAHRPTDGSPIPSGTCGDSPALPAA